MSVTSAASTAMSEPAPIAKLTSAAASAGASLTPSPTMPVTTPCAFSARTASALSCGSTPARYSSMPTRRATAARRRLVVAGQHDHADARGVEAPTASRGARTHRVGQRDGADARVPRARRRRSSCPRPRAARSRSSAAVRAQMLGRAKHRRRRRRHRRDARRRRGPASRRNPRSAATRHLRPSRRRGSPWRADASSPARGLPPPAARRRALRRPERHDVGDDRPPFGERAGLVDDQRLQPARLLERRRVADQDAGLRAAPGADHDRRRRGEAQRARARDDEHGHGVHERARGIAGRATTSRRT